MYEREYDSRFGSVCPRCDKSDPSVDHTVRYKCFECFQAPPLCKPCILDAHKHAPFHDVHEWTGSYLRKVSLSSVGLVICLGHDEEKCPSAGDARMKMTIVHGGGIREMEIVQCTCGDSQAKGSLALRLWRSGLFPATFIRPGTVISAGALSDFHLLTQTAKVNATAFCTFLRRKTDYWAQDTVKNRAREFFMSFRMYCYLNNLKSNGFDAPRPASGVDPGYELSPGSMAVLCPACPQPSINMSPNWRERDEALR
ncbi:hypothetical protein AURDEDRAFT_77292 [Auricularia subglabra TFB-10046 SS5]|uniref:CxC2-like cysteine cluster KDZ transposase-associated domain-containing protein n=1 Tax=Auricularia subglabra (strain TFB-10046 / SS5) TaxID=717982 RepID=J0WL31_AURST|nr:hypothetical protein AURDEDRAFT_77292 [Auricularia subglabra TFB-10046 SS5]